LNNLVQFVFIDFYNTFTVPHHPIWRMTPILSIDTKWNCKNRTYIQYLQT